MSTKDTKPRQQGDVLGISHATGSIPHDNVPKGGHPAGIELDSTNEKSGRNLPRGSGATGIDMGAGGEGTDIEPTR